MGRFVKLEFDPPEQGRFGESEPQKDAAYFLDQASEAFQLGDFDSSLRAYSKLLEFDATHSAAWVGQAQALIELDQLNRGRQWVTKGLEQLEGEPELLAASSVILSRLGDNVGAMAYSDIAMESGASLPYVWHARGDVLLGTNDRQSEYCFEKAAALDERNWLWPWFASRAHHWRENFSLALKHAQRAIAQDAGQCMAWAQTGHCQKELGLINLATDSYQQARQLNPHCAEVHEALAGISRLGAFARLCFWARGLFSRS